MDVEARIALASYLDRELICLEPVLRECNICLPFILNVSLLRFLSFFLSFHIDRLQVGIRTSRRMAKAIRCSKATGKLTITFSIQCGLACSFTALMFWKHLTKLFIWIFTQIFPSFVKANSHRLLYCLTAAKQWEWCLRLRTLICMLMCCRRVCWWENFFSPHPFFFLTSVTGSHVTMLKYGWSVPDYLQLPEEW